MNRRIARLVMAGSVCAAFALGFVALTSQRAEAARPRPDCGPTRLWICSGVGPDVLFGGTVCDKAAYEKKTGRTCVPYAGDF
jgi:hypothetical protein